MTACPKAPSKRDPRHHFDLLRHDQNFRQSIYKCRNCGILLAKPLGEKPQQIIGPFPTMGLQNEPS